MRLRAAITALACLLASPAAGADPQMGPAARVVSLDYCADAYLLALAAPGAIAALSPDADAPYSYIRDRANAFPQHGGSAEEILTLAPDLVLRSGVADRRLDGFLERQAIPTASLGYAQSLADARQALRSAGAALGREARADQLLAEMDRRQARLAERVAALDALGPRPTALYVTPSGITTGSGTYIDEAFGMAGIVNLLGSEGVEGFSLLTVEDLATRRPDLMVASFFDSRRGWRADWRFAQHPVAARAMGRAARVAVPARQWGCAGYYLLDAVESLIDGRADWQRERLLQARATP